MAKKSAAIGIVSAAAAGAGAAYLVRKVKGSEGPEAGKKKERKEKDRAGTEPGAGYRNTELGKHEKNRKGIYYSSGNYEAFARPEKPEGVEEKNAYIVGSGLAALAAA